MRCCLAAIALIGSSVGAVSALDRTWSGPSTTPGSWHVAANWNNLSPPGASDYANFFSSSTVTLSSNVTIDTLNIYNGVHDFRLGGRTLTTTYARMSHSTGFRTYLGLTNGRLRVVDNFLLDSSQTFVNVGAGATLQVDGQFRAEGFNAASLGALNVSGGTATLSGIRNSNIGAMEINVLDNGTLNSGPATFSSTSTTGSSPLTPYYSVVSVSDATWNAAGLISLAGAPSRNLRSGLFVTNGTVNATAGIVTTSHGLVRLQSGSIDVPSFDNAGGLELFGGTLTIHGGALNNHGQTLTLRGSSIFPTATLRLVEGADATGVNRVVVGDSRAGRMVVEAGSELTNGAEAFIGLGSQSAGAAVVQGTGARWTNVGPLSVGEFGDGSLDVLAGGVVTNAAAQIAASSGSSGDVTVSGQGSRWNCSGGLEVGGSSAGPGGVGTVFVGPGGELEVGEGLRVWGPGVLTVAGGDVIASQLDLRGELGVRVPASGDVGSINVSGPATLDGILRLTLDAAFTPAAGASFDVLSAAGGFTGDFDMYALPALPGNLLWEKRRTATSLTLAIASPSPADFNDDSDVDGEDLAAWKVAYGPTAAADADSDGDSDGADFLVWQRQLTAPAAAIASTAVPEPATASMAVILLCGMLTAAIWRVDT